MSVALGGVGTARAQTPVAGPWVSQDIGQPAITGDATGDGTSFTITAGGEDIWGTSDQFHFVYQPLSGDVDIRARVDGVTNADRWSKAGVMIRASLAANSAHGFALVSAGKGMAFQRRTATGGISTHTAGPYVTPPRWVRLVKSGSTVTAYSSTDGSNWSVMGTDTIPFGSTFYVGVAVTSHNPGSATTATVSQVSVAAAAEATTTLPAGQSQRDIGSPAIKGSGSYKSGTYTIKAGGRDIWDTSDQFHYVYQQATGDIDTSVRIASLGYASSWSKAGVMIRETLGAGSTHAFALVSAGNGYAFQRRTATGGTSDHTSGTSGKAPGWLRLKRNGDLFTAYQSPDGTNWTVIGSDNIPMGATVYVGIAVTSHNTSKATTATADHFTAGSPSGGNQPPTVSLTAPSNGASYTAPATITLTANASDPENQLSKVEFYAGSTRLATDTAAPYSYSWSSVAAGSYSLTAKAYDAAGAVTTSSPVSVTVGSANRPPTVSLTAPSNGASYTAPATITLTANASDPENQLSKVEFYAGSTRLATDTAAPYSYSWSSVAAGSYSLTAKAYDAAGAVTTSSAVSVTVTATTTAPTGIAFTASADQATVTSYRLDVFASGADPNTATPVATTNLGKPTPDASNTITVTNLSSFFSALASGTYQATVSAINSGGTGRSAPISFTR